MTQDIPPFVMIDGMTNKMVGLNRVGLQRAGVDSSEIRQVKAAYRIAFRSDLKFEDRIETLRRQFPVGAARQFWEFLTGGKRGFVQDRRTDRDDQARVADFRLVSDSNQANNAA